MIIKNDTQAVHVLHEVARYVEQHFGEGPTSAKVRECADTVYELAKAEHLYGKKNKPVPTAASVKVGK